MHFPPLLLLNRSYGWYSTSVKCIYWLWGDQRLKLFMVGMFGLLVDGVSNDSQLDHILDFVSL